MGNSPRKRPVEWRTGVLLQTKYAYTRTVSDAPNVRQRIAGWIVSEAENFPQRKCWTYVRIAIQRALRIKEQPTGIDKARNAGRWLKAQGFGYISNKDAKFENGDVVLYHKKDDNVEAGHSQVYADGRWYSDFRQKNFNVYGKPIIWHHYRYGTKESEYTVQGASFCRPYY